MRGAGDAGVLRLIDSDVGQHAIDHRGIGEACLAEYTIQHDFGCSRRWRLGGRWRCPSRTTIGRDTEYSIRISAGREWHVDLPGTVTGTPHPRLRIFTQHEGGH